MEIKELRWRGKLLNDLTKNELIEVIWNFYNRSSEIVISVPTMGKKLYQEAEKG